MLEQNQLDAIKNRISNIYLESVAAKLGYSVQKEGIDFDSLGIDYQISRKIVGSKKTTFSALKDVINVQLKSTSCSSSSVYREETGVISYKLDESLFPIEGQPLYLFLVVVPEQAKYEQWIECTPEYLAIKKCAYYFKIEKETKGTIKIPKSNLLNHESIKSLFNDGQN